MLLVGGSAGSVTGFLIASLIGAYEGIEMDSLVLAFLVASLLGFFFGAGLVWLFLHYFSSFVNELSASSVEPVGQEMTEETATEEPLAEGPVVATEDEKGQSVDFTFPEFTPDKQ
ncbi:MAG TPA: hypothetical protein VHE12_14125 [bacterium]|nr:hypothetical protein [bacterium]